MPTRTLCFIGLLALVPACGSTEDLVEDRIEAALNDDPSDTSDSNFTYYSVRPDLRRCAAPLCGGAWVRRVNQQQTRCADDRYESECYVADFDFSRLGLSLDDIQNLHANEDRLLLRGYVRAQDYGDFGRLGLFQASEAWLAASDRAPSGIFYRVK